MAEEPGAYVLGVGVRPTADPAEVERLVHEVLVEAGVGAAAVRAVATVHTRVDHPALVALPWPVVGYSPDTLAGVLVGDPSARVAEALGTASVAEAAALLAAGPDAGLIVPKRRSPSATVAVARTSPHPSDVQDAP